MKVKIGPHIGWVGPYQIADAVFLWPSKDYDAPETWRHRAREKFGSWLADTWVADFCQWIQDHRRRHVYVQVDDYDVWSADNTLSLIALPLLKKLRERKHGAPMVDDADVPEYLRSTSSPPTENSWDEDANFFERWNWVLDEMIWAHEQEATDNPAEEACWTHGLPDPMWPYKSYKNGFDEMMGGIKCDDEALKQFHERKANGFRLFGKYYQALWD